MKRLHLFLAACCCALPLFSHAQGLGNFVDAANFIMAPPGSLVSAVGGASDQKLAQTLTVEVGGTLEGVFLPLSCAGAGKIHVEIHDVVGGLPGPTVLADRAVAPSALDAPGNRFTFVHIPGALALASGQRVAIVVYASKPNLGGCGMAQSQVSANYPGGRSFFDSRPNPPGWVANGDFVDTPDDYPFQLVLS